MTNNSGLGKINKTLQIKPSLTYNTSIVSMDNISFFLHPCFYIFRFLDLDNF